MKKTSLAIALAAILPGIASAGAPINYGGWTTTTTAAGTSVNMSACPSGYSCDSQPIVDDGFYQRQITNTATGSTYFQTVIVDTAGVAGTNVAASAAEFQTESFVTSGSTAVGGGGIAANQTLNSTEAGLTQASMKLAMGTFNVASEDKVVMTQDTYDASTGAGDSTYHGGFTFNKHANDSTTLGMTQQILDQSANSATANDFAMGLSYQQQNDATGAETGVSLDITMGVQLDTTAAGGTINDQTVQIAQRTGSYNTAASTYQLADGSSSLSPTFTAGTNYADGQLVSIGQSVVGAGQFTYGALTDNATGNVLTNDTTGTNAAQVVLAPASGSDLFSVGIFSLFDAGDRKSVV